MKMQDHLTPETAGWVAALVYKFFPPLVGAMIMAAVALPKDRRELFLRVAVGFGCSWLFGDAVFAWLHSTAWFAFLDPANSKHKTAIDGLLGASGWFLMGAGAVALQKLRTDPLGAAKGLRR